MKRRELTDRERKSVIAAYESEATVDQITQRFKIGTTRLYEIWTEAGFGPRRRGPSVEYGHERPRGAR